MHHLEARRVERLPEQWSVKTGGREKKQEGRKKFICNFSKTCVESPGSRKQEASNERTEVQQIPAD